MWSAPRRWSTVGGPSWPILLFARPIALRLTVHYRGLKFAPGDPLTVEVWALNDGA